MFDPSAALSNDLNSCRNLDLSGNWKGTREEYREIRGESAR